jgi:hypothetical protein
VTTLYAAVRSSPIIRDALDWMDRELVRFSNELRRRTLLLLLRPLLRGAGVLRDRRPRSGRATSRRPKALLLESAGARRPLALPHRSRRRLRHRGRRALVLQIPLQYLPIFQNADRAPDHVNPGRRHPRTAIDATPAGAARRPAAPPAPPLPVRTGSASYRRRRRRADAAVLRARSPGSACRCRSDCCHAPPRSSPPRRSARGASSSIR